MNEVKNQNDMVKEILEYLRDDPEGPGRTEFLGRLDQLYTTDDRIHWELRNEDREKCLQEEENRRQCVENKKQRKAEKAKRIKR